MNMQDELEYVQERCPKWDCKFGYGYVQYGIVCILKGTEHLKDIPGFAPVVVEPGNLGIEEFVQLLHRLENDPEYYNLTDPEYVQAILEGKFA